MVARPVTAVDRFRVNLVARKVKMRRMPALSLRQPHARPNFARQEED
jgi:hypothetical protein